MATGEIERLEALTTSINKLVEKLDSSGHTQVVIHKQAGPGGLLAAAVTACFASMLFALLVYFVLAKDIADTRRTMGDHDAYIHMAREDIAKLKAENKGR